METRSCDHSGAAQETRHLPPLSIMAQPLEGSALGTPPSHHHLAPTPRGRHHRHAPRPVPGPKEPVLHCPHIVEPP
eukprot:3412234-Heterocapsa_arctica.AAC.1